MRAEIEAERKRIEAMPDGPEKDAALAALAEKEAALAEREEQLAALKEYQEQRKEEAAGKAAGAGQAARASGWSRRGLTWRWPWGSRRGRRIHRSSTRSGEQAALWHCQAQSCCLEEMCRFNVGRVHFFFLF